MVVTCFGICLTMTPRARSYLAPRTRIRAERFSPVSAHQRKPKIASRGLNGIEWTKEARGYRHRLRRISACAIVYSGGVGRLHKIDPP